MEAGKCLIIVWLKRCPRVSYHQRSSGENSLWEGGMTDHLSSFLSMIIFACAPAWGATILLVPHGGTRNLSTHAPAWGATNCKSVLYQVDRLFLLTPPRGGRRGETECLSLKKFYFYSRPRVGGDQCRRIHAVQFSRISTHAPAWGATNTTTQESYIRNLFLLTPPRGGRPFSLGLKA